MYDFVAHNAGQVGYKVQAALAHDSYQLCPSHTGTMELSRSAVATVQLSSIEAVRQRGQL